MIAGAIGSAAAGPLGGLLASLAGGLLDTIFPGLGTPLAGVVSNLSSDAVGQAQSRLVERLFPEPPERQRINHDLQTAFRDAARAALYDIGGPECFPAHWPAGGRDVPAAARYPLGQHGPELAARLAACLRELERAIADERLLALDPPADQPAASAAIYLQQTDPLALSAAFYDSLFAPFLADQFASLTAEVPALADHLRRCMLDRTLVHLAELLKQRSRAWRAFNRLMLEQLRDQVRQIGAGQSEILARLDTLLAHPDAPALGEFSAGMAELLAATGRAEKRAGEGFDALLARVAAQHAETLAQLQAITVTSLRIEHKVDRVLEILASGEYVIHGGATPAPADAQPAPGDPPFKGLCFFDTTDTDQFYGREALTARLVARLRATLTPAAGAGDPGRFLAVIGASGSGKSSLVRAGLIPALARGAPLADGSLPPLGSAQWPAYVLSPTARPLDALALSLTRDVESVTAAATLADDLMRDPRSLDLAARRLLAGRPASERLLLVIDQFEELFTLCRHEPASAAFVAALLHAAASDGPVVVVVALRADFYAACARYDALRAALAARQEYIGPMCQQELRRAIEEPARRGGWSFEPGLVDLLLRDVGDEPGALPLLSHALLETWQRRRGRLMTLESYAESGMVRGAIAKTAETVFRHQLAPQQQALARAIFLRLTELGEGVQDTRRRAALDELVPRAEDAPAVAAVLQTLADTRLITTGDGTAEVAHEALIREWPTLRRWLEEDRDGLRVHRALAEDAREWERMRRDAGGLYRGARLAAAAEWAGQHAEALNALERMFLEASQAAADAAEREREAARQRELAQAQALAEEQRRRAEDRAAAAARLRRRAIGLVGALAIALLAGALAGLFGVRAGHSAAEAQNQRSTALAEGQRAESQRATAEAERDRAERNAAESHSLALAAAARDALNSSEYDRALALAQAANQIAGPPAQAQLILSKMAYTSPRRRFVGHTAGVVAVAFSPDGRSILSGSNDTTLRLWDATTAREICQLKGHTDSITSVAFNPDGRTVLSGSEDDTIRLWDVTTCREKRRLVGHTGDVISVAISPDGKTAISNARDSTARLWDITTGQELHRFKGQTKAVAFSPDGRSIFAIAYPGTFTQWDARSGSTLRKFGTNITSSSMALSPDGKSILCSDSDNMLQLWDIASGQNIRHFEGHTGAVNSVAFSPDGRSALSGADDDTMRLWDVASGKEIARFKGSAYNISSVTFSPDGRAALAGSMDDTIRIWDVLGGAEQRRVTHSSALTSVVFGNEGRNIVTGSDDATIRLWDSSAQEIRRFEGHTDAITSVALSPDGRTILSGSIDTTLRLWDVASGRELRRFEGSAEAVRAVSFSPDGMTVLAGGDDRVLRLWDAGSAQLLHSFAGHTDAINTVAFSPDGHTILSGSSDNTMRLWDIATGLETHRFDLFGGDIYDAAFSPDGRAVLAGGSSWLLQLWDIASEQELRHFTGHTGWITSVAFSPDGRSVFSGSLDKTVRLWDVATGLQIRHFAGHTDDVIGVALSPDGRTASSVSEDHTMRLWRIDTLNDLLAWSKANNDSPELTCDEQALYQIAAPCTAPTSTLPAPP